jgi:Mrp family chromosome partitioning ATPase
MNLLTDYTDDPSTDRGSLGIVSTGVPGLDLLPLGSSHEDLSYMTEARLYESDAFASLFSQWRQNYRYILFDAAPASVNTSTLYLAKQVDRVLWILEAEKTRQPVAFNLKEQFSNSGAAVWGVIFNKRKFHIPHWLYYIV